MVALSLCALPSPAQTGGCDVYTEHMPCLPDDRPGCKGGVTGAAPALKGGG